MGKKLLIISLFLFLGSHISQGQKPERMYQYAETVFYSEDFDKARSLFEDLEEVDKNFADLQYKLEICSLLTIKSYNDLSKFYNYAKKEGRRDRFYNYWKGRIELEKYKFEEAIVSLTAFIDSPSDKSQIILQEARRWIQWCIRAKQSLDNPAHYEIHLLEETINSANAELSPVFFEDNEELLFISNKGSEDPEVYRIFHTKHEGERRWTIPTPIDNVGSFTRETANIEVVAEDGRLFQFRKDKGGDLFYSEPKADQKTGWTDPVEFDSRISSTQLSSHFFINEHEDRIIFAKNVGSRKEPNLDLFESIKDPSSGNWSKPLLFSTSINSEYNEDSPYLSPDEKTLYFASDGHETMGGYDIFKSTYDEVNRRWTEPENMGFPVNSPDDEIHFKMNSTQTSGYFTSNRLNTYGDFDIFFFWELEKVSIKGLIVRDGNPLNEGRIYFRPENYEDMYFYSEVNADGTYTADITDDELFIVEIKLKNGEVVPLPDFRITDAEKIENGYKQDFEFGTTASEEIAAESETGISETTKADDSKYTSEWEHSESLSSLGSKFNTSDRAELDNIYFQFGDTSLDQEHVEDLEAIRDVLAVRTKMKIEVAGHTDNVGSHDTNMKVSQNRAQQVKNWLVAAGISADRITAKGYGETEPLASNDDEINGRELNRRIEIRVK